MKLINSFRDELLAGRDRWALWLPVPMALGIVFYFSLPAEPPVLAGATALLFLTVAAVPFWRNRAFMHFWIAAFIFALGFATGQARTLSVAAPVLHKKTPPLTVEGRVTHVDLLEKGARVVLDRIEIENFPDERGRPESVRVRLKKNDAAVPEAGDVVRVRAVLLPLSPPVLPGAFDFQRHAFFKRLGATGYAISDVAVVEKGEEGFFFARMRRHIRAHIEENISDKDHAALITAFITGEDKGIPEKTWEICRLSGIAHLIAISGSHFVLIAGFAFFIVRALLALVPYFALNWPVKKIAAGAAIAVALFYMMLIGAPLPAQRAALSICIVMGAIMLDRDPFTLRLVAFSAMAILLFEPEALMGASFQMSFAAVAGLVAFYEATREWWKSQLEDAPRHRRYALYLLACFLSTWVASIATAPFSLYHFSRMSLAGGLVANMIAVPVSSFITFPAGLLACLLMPFGLEGVPLMVADKSLGLIMNVAETVAAWPHAVHHMDAWPPLLLGVITLGGLWLAVWQGRVRFLGLVPVAAAALLIPLTPRADILVDGRLNLFAVRGPEGKLWVSSKTKEKFVRTEWAEREGGAKPAFYPAEGETQAISCTLKTCTYKAKGHTVVIVKSKTGLPRDCGEASLILSVEPFTAEKCRARTKLLDRWDIWRKGAHAIYLREGGGMVIDTVRDSRGRRPWTGGR